MTGTDGEVAAGERRNHETVAALREDELAVEEFARLRAALGGGGGDRHAAVRGIDHRPEGDLLECCERHERRRTGQLDQHRAGDRRALPVLANTGAGGAEEVVEVFVVTTAATAVASPAPGHT